MYHILFHDLWVMDSGAGVQGAGGGPLQKHTHNIECDDNEECDIYYLNSTGPGAKSAQPLAVNRSNPRWNMLPALAASSSRLIIRMNCRHGIVSTSVLSPMQMARLCSVGGVQMQLT